MEPLTLSVKYADTPSHHTNHFHDCHQLIYVARGSVRVTVSGREYRAVDGTILLISRFEQHALSVESSQYRRYTLEVGGTLPEDSLFSMLINRPAEFSHAVDMSGCPEIALLLEKMALECSRKLPLHTQMLAQLFRLLLILLCRHHPELDSAQALPLVQQIQRLFESSYHRQFTLEDLAEEFHISQSYLCHRFKQTTGQSVMGYLTACRIAAAKRLLTQTLLPISAVVEACGFTDNSNFSRTFHRAAGMTPTQFRQRFSANSPNFP